jgi:hypothetical protein
VHGVLTVESAAGVNWHSSFHLTNERKLAPGSILIAVAALRFLYRITAREGLPFDVVIPAPHPRSRSLVSTTAR